MQSFAQAASGIMDSEIMVMQNLRLYKVAKVIGEWMRTNTTKEDSETNMAKII